MSSSSFTVVSIAPVAGGGDEDRSSPDERDASSDGPEEEGAGKGELGETDKAEGDALNMCSTSFDAGRALFDNSFDISFAADQPVLDNVEKFVALSKGKIRPKDKDKEKGEQGATGDERSSSSMPDRPIPGRNFTHDQLPIHVQQKPTKNVVEYMRRCSKPDFGPLSVLKRCVDDKTRVRVILRGPVGIRGHCTGYLIAFDKHWNLALVDVDETYTRRRQGKPVLDSIEDEFAVKLSVDERMSSRTEVVGASVTKVIKTRRKTELCERHVPQIVLRGEHVVSVIVSS